MSTGMFGNAVAISHQLIARVVRAGDMVIDATCGRGRDTLYLARLVGPGGKVYAFDVQEEAIKSTRELLTQNDCLDQVMLINDNHNTLASYVKGHPSACMFNLGYLPGGDHQLTTKSEDTLQALVDGLALLTDGGIITLVFYPGIPSGQEEIDAMEKYLSKLPQQKYEITRISFINQINNPPQLICIEKLNGGQK